MSFDPRDPNYGVPSSTLNDWEGLRGRGVASDPAVTVWYHPSSGRMVQYNSTTDQTTVLESTGTTAGTRSRVENDFRTQINNAQLRTTQQAVTQGTASGSAILGSIPQTNRSQNGGRNNVARNSYPTSYYPQSLATTKQDRIKFEMRTAGTRNLTPSASTSLGGFSRRTTGTPLGEVYLAVPNQISDSNSADWSSATMTPMQSMLASLALKGMRSEGDVSQMLSKLAGDAMKNLKDFAKTSANRDALQLYLAQEAAGAQGLLSRVGGVVANPNVELLFNGPSLRPFTFSFRMAPRSSLEAEQVKRIIRFFKEGMAVQTTDQDIFLKSPNVFNIQFQSGNDNSAHKSLPRIKTCALIGCDVDYTPDGSYMTFDDEQKGYPMTCYQMTLRFNEIEPVYAADYREINSDDDIGY